MRRSQLADRKVVVRERLEHVAPRTVGERREHRVEVVVRILNH